jgi:putative colanic acid biosynthesis acetyltransferase WcaF
VFDSALPVKNCERVQRLDEFRLPPNFRGRNGVIVLLWQIVQTTLFAWSPQPLYAWRRFLLRCFGAKIGRDVLIRPTVRITYPWKVQIGDRSWVGDNAELYSLGLVFIGSDAVVSQRSYLCTGSHDFRATDFAIFTKPVIVNDSVWIAADVFVAPGVTIGRGAVIGARSSVFENVPEMVICKGSPARVVGPRTMREP